MFEEHFFITVAALVYECTQLLTQAEQGSSVAITDLSPSAAPRVLKIEN